MCFLFQGLTGVLYRRTRRGAQRRPLGPPPGNPPRRTGLKPCPPASPNLILISHLQ